ncbi:MAG TPA: glycoside hydrolase family 19 protein [Methylobacter sp.]|jgi:predicted chitinase
MLKSDSQGFLIGEPVHDIRKAVDQLRTIRNDISAIKNALLGAPNSAGNGSKNTAIDRAAKIATPSSQRNRDNKPSAKAATPVRSNSGAGTPSIASAASTGTVTPNGRAKAAIVATPKGRDASGRFSSKTESDAKRDKTTGRFTSNGGDDDERRTKGVLNNFVDRIATTAIGATAGAEEVDPAIKAFQEVAEPMQRGYQSLFGGGDKDKKERWYKKLFKELNLFRKDETAFNKAQNKILKNIEGKSSGGDSDSSGTMLMMTGLLGRLGPMLLTGITGVLGLIFSPIGLAIGAAATIAWGLFTENGQKFFGEVGAKILAGWDGVVTAFAPITESIGKGWDDVKSRFDSLINGMSSTWDAFTGFLKDKFGIDIPAIFKPVVDVSKKAVEVAKETVNAGADKAVETVKKSSPKTTEALGNVWNKVQEGAGKISAHATGKSATNKAAMMAEMDAQGITDPTERAMLMAQVDHESGNFAFSKELGNDAYFDKYDAGTKIGKRLGNTEKGDGAKYKGRGFIQLTGRANYEAAGKDLGLDLINHPELAETPENAAKTALWFWKKNKLGDSAKKGDVTTNRHGVNGGENGLADVKQKFGQYLAEYKKPESEPAKGKPYLDKVAAINAGNIPLYNSLAAGPSADQTQNAFAAAPKVPTFTPAPVPADAPPQITPLASLNSDRNVTVTMPSQDVSQDLSSRPIAHIATGGLSGRG